MYAHLVEPPAAALARSGRSSPPTSTTSIARAMAKQPDDRQPSAGDLGRAAAVVVHGERDAKTERMVATGAAAPGGAPTEPGLATEAPTRSRSRAQSAADGEGGADGRCGSVVARSWRPERRRQFCCRATGTVGGGARTSTSAPPVTKGPTIPGVGDRPNGVAVAGGDVWVMSFRERRLARIDGKTESVGPGPRRRPGHLRRGRRRPRAVGDELADQRGRAHRRAERPGHGAPERAGPADRGRHRQPGGCGSRRGEEVLRYDRRTRRLRDRTAMPGGVVAMTVAPGGVWIAERTKPMVAFVRATTGRVGSRIRLTGQPYDVAFDAPYLWASIRADDTVARVEPETREVVTVEAATRPARLAAACGLIFVAGYTDHAVVTIDPGEGPARGQAAARRA